MVFVADDGDTNLHQNDAEKMALIVDNNRKEFRVDKLYLDAYVQESNRSPDASKALIDQISYGNLFVNYTGHGNTTILAGEYLFTESMIEELSNNIKMPFFVTATCDFGKYDDVTEVTGGEQLFLLPYGGAIGLLTSTRKVYANTNLEINRAFYDAAFEKENNKFKRLGDIIKETKNNSLSGYNNRNYGLLGDPSMHLAFPDYEMKITHINDELVGTADTLKALGIYKVKGAIFNEDQVMDSFTGEATVTVLDKPDKFITLDEDNADVYDINNVILFNGKAQVVNGQFEISILIPKNINYAFGSGKVYLYAVNSTKMMDAHGSFTDAIIGGSVQQEVKDRQGPEITLLINDSTFTSGQSVGVNSLFIAKIKDESGVNLSSLGFSNQLMLSIDDEEPFLVSKYYTSELDTYEEGTILFPLEDLSEGKHSIYLEASDVFNNESNASIEFVVSENNVLPLLNVVNYPNPLTSKDDEMTIAFNHDRIGEDLIVDFEIINMQGREILANQYRFDNVAEERLYLKWDLLSNSKGRLDAGLYFYRLKVKSNLDGTSNELYNKILILK